MKKSIKFMAMLLCAAMVFGVASCDRNDDTTNNDGNGDDSGDDNVVSCGETLGEWVDLGLPSGTLWYSVNIGASSPEETGCYFAWGETTAKEVYDWGTYRYCTVDANGNMSTLTKYITERWSEYGTADNKTVLESSDDVATTVLGSGARIPTNAEWRELLDNTTAEETMHSSVKGFKFTSTNGNSIFLPCAGFFKRDEFIYYEGNKLDYWSSSLGEVPVGACHCTNSDGNIPKVWTAGGGRYIGLPVRAVRAGQN